MTTPKLGMDEVAASQSQPEVPINASLRLLDVLVQCNVLSQVAALPGSPSEGDAYILTATTGGGSAADIAYYSGGWNFISPQLGWMAYVIDEAARYEFVGGSPAGWELFAAAGGGGGAAAADTYNTASPATGVLTLNDPDIDVWLVDLNGNVTSIILPTAPSGEALSVLVLFKQDPTGGRTVTGWPTMTWESGSAPTITSTANAVTSVPVLILGNGDIYGVA